MDPSQHDKIRPKVDETLVRSFLESLRRGEIVPNPTTEGGFTVNTGTQQSCRILEEQILRQTAASGSSVGTSNPPSRIVGWPTSLPANTPPRTDVRNPTDLIENETLKYLFANTQMKSKQQAMEELAARQRQSKLTDETNKSIKEVLANKQMKDEAAIIKARQLVGQSTDLSNKSLREILGNVIDVFELKSVFPSTQSQVRPPPGFEKFPAPVRPIKSAPWVGSEGGLPVFDNSPSTSLDPVFKAKLPVHDATPYNPFILNSSKMNEGVERLMKAQARDKPEIWKLMRGESERAQLSKNQSDDASEGIPDTFYDSESNKAYCNDASSLHKGKSHRQSKECLLESSSQNSESSRKNKRGKRGSGKSGMKNEENKSILNDVVNKPSRSKNEEATSAFNVKRSTPPGILPPPSGVMFTLKDVEKASMENMLDELMSNEEYVERKGGKRNRKKNEKMANETRAFNDRPNKLAPATREQPACDLQNKERSGRPTIYLPTSEGSFSFKDVEKESAINMMDRLSLNEEEDDTRSKKKRNGKRGKGRQRKLEDNDRAINLTPSTNEQFSSTHQNEEKTPSNPKKNNRNEDSETTFQDYLDLEAVKKGLSNKTLIKGELRINMKNFKECYINDPGEGKDILIAGILDRNRALEGDIVVVQLKVNQNQHKGDKEVNNTKVQKTGKVVHIFEKVHTRECIGHLTKVGEGDNAIFCPRDSRVPRFFIPSPTIPVSILQNPQAHKDMLFKAKIVEWSSTKFALGLLVENLGRKGELETETLAILQELNLNPNPVSEEFCKDLHFRPIPQDEIMIDRADLRKECIFTIDPATARDLDDALSIKKLDENRYKVGVHISDITYYLKLGSKLDEVVSQRATTIYMVDKAIHMLPIELCMQCSLLPGQDKYALSVLWEMDGEGNILEEEFTRTAIHSCAKLSYEQAQDVIAGKTPEFPTIHNNYSPEDVKQSILQLYSLSVKMRERRFKNGALRIDQPKVNFRIDESSMPVSLQLEELRDSNRLIEEFMLQANQSVAAAIHTAYPKIALLRRHAPPKVAMIDKLIQSLSTIGINVKSSSSKDIHDCIVDNSGGHRNRQIVLSCLFSKPMMRAEYFCYDPESHHYALSVDMYTHFTSPIRRYVDVVVHRLLCSILGYEDQPKWDTEDVRQFCQVSNKKKYAAKRASELSGELFTALYIRKMGSIEAEGIVHNVISHAVDILVTSLALTIRVYLERLPAKLIFEDKAFDSSLTVIWNHAPHRPVVYCMFSNVNVRLSVAEGSLNIEAELLPQTPLA